MHVHNKINIETVSVFCSQKQIVINNLKMIGKERRGRLY